MPSVTLTSPLGSSHPEARFHASTTLCSSVTSVLKILICRVKASPLLPHLTPHPQQLPHRPRRQTLHLIMQLRNRFKKSRHRRQPLPRKIRPRFLRIQLLQTPPQHLPRRIDLPPLPLFNHQPEHLPHIFHRLIMFPPVPQHMHRPHNPPPPHLPDPS